MFNVRKCCTNIHISASDSLSGIRFVLKSRGRSRIKLTERVVKKCHEILFYASVIFVINDNDHNYVGVRRVFSVYFRKLVIKADQIEFVQSTVTSDQFGYEKRAENGSNLYSNSERAVSR